MRREKILRNFGREKESRRRDAGLKCAKEEKKLSSILDPPDESGDENVPTIQTKVGSQLISGSSRGKFYQGEWYIWDYFSVPVPRSLIPR